MKKLFILLIAATLMQPAFSQTGKLDSLFASGDTTAVMDSLLKDFDSFLDSLSKPKSFFSVSVGAGTGLFSFQDKSSVNFNTEKKLIVSPMIGYFNKTGFGISATAFAMNDKNKIKGGTVTGLTGSPAKMWDIKVNINSQLDTANLEDVMLLINYKLL